MNKLKNPSRFKKGVAEKFFKYLSNTDYSFRPGASVTTLFGYTAYDGKNYNEFPGIHKGVDRSKGIVISPFDFNRSGFKNWNGRLWGSDVYLYHIHNFRLRISHMFPNDIKCLEELQNREEIRKDTEIGLTGKYGTGLTGNHSHVEIESWGFKGKWLKTCDILDWLLIFVFGEKSLEPFNEDEIINITREKCHGVVRDEWTNDFILEYYRELLRRKSILFINKHKMVILSSKHKKPTTLYNSISVFNM